MRHILNFYRPLEIKRVNIFTDGCAEQYKSRRNAYFIAELAQEFSIIVTHNYAPTAAFKTMVDGQGDLAKSTYRKLEKDEVEGTRCSTSYDLFKLFTSEYPMTPADVPDLEKRLMTITNRKHRFLVDKADSTDEMNRRAASEKDVIVTDYIGERWDAPVLRGIKSIFSLIGRAENDIAKLYSRSHACFCQSCMEGDFNGCSQVHTVGCLKEEVVKKLPFKEHVANPAQSACEEVEKLNYFKNVLGSNVGEEVIVAIIKENIDDMGEKFELAIMTKGAKKLKKDFQYNFLINGISNKITLEKNTWCITVRFLQCTDHRNRDYSIPVKAKEVKVSIEAVHYIQSKEDDESKLKHTSRSEAISNSQTRIIYTIDERTLDTIRGVLTPNSNIENDSLSVQSV